MTVQRRITEYLQEIFSKMSTTANINLNKLYFEYKVLTKIIGEPTFDKLHEIFWQLKANMAAVLFNLGRGVNGYLGMLVSATQYNTVSPDAPFVPPPMPGHLVINPAYTQYQITMAKTQYEAALREHQTYILMQILLIALVKKQYNLSTQTRCEIASQDNCPRTFGS